MDIDLASEALSFDSDLIQLYDFLLFNPFKCSVYQTHYQI